MIRGVIREFTTTATAAGAKHKGYESPDRKSAQSDYDAKSADYDTKSAAVDNSKKYRQASRKGGYSYRSTPLGGWSLNPDWTTQNNAKIAAGDDKTAARIAKDTAETTLNKRKAADLEKTRPTQKPPSGGGAGFGKGKTAGKGKGKKKK